MAKCQSSKRSNKRNVARKATQFKKKVGPRNVLSADLPEIPGTSTVTVDSQPGIASRMNRLTAAEATDVQAVKSKSDSSDVKSADVFAYKLRPQPETDEAFAGDDGYPFDENVIINVRKMSELINHVHGQLCKKPNMSVYIGDRAGLCITMYLECSYCHYKSPAVQMSDTVKKARGPPAGALNEMLAVAIYKSGGGLQDAFRLLSCLNIKVPSAKTMQKKVNSQGEEAINQNEKQMLKDQDYFRNVSNHAGVERAEADMQFDVAFSSRPQGGSEKAAQSFGALIEHTTSRKLTLAVASANKHCRLNNCNHQNCSKNYPNESSIASSERVLVQQTLKSIHEAGRVKMRSITTDSSAQVAKAIRDYQNATPDRAPAIHYKCFVHRLRTLEKHIRQLNLKSIPRAYDKAGYTQKLAACVRARVRLELTSLHARRPSDANFIKASSAAVGNVIQCFSGNHTLCRQVSLVCISHLKHYSTASLPYGMHITLNKVDLDIIQTKINKMFDNNGLRDLSKLYNTNMCESLHAAVFNYAPKTTCWTRNFTALCHSATHSRTLGPGHSTIQLARAAGVNVQRRSQFYITMKARDRLRQYHSRRKASASYKQARFYLRKRRSNRTLFHNSLYSNDNAASCSASEHSYGLST